MRNALPAAIACALALATATLAGATATASEPTYDYWPRWSPDGKRILFDRDGTAIVMDASGRRPRRLPGSLPGDVAGDGRVVLLEQHPGGAHLVVMRHDGSGRRVVTRGRDDDTSPHWSPDGRTILFERRGRGQDVWSVGGDGRRLRRLTTDRRSSLGDTTQPWGPDGRRFAYEGCGPRCGEVHVLDAAGRTRPRHVTPAQRNESATWSPRGSLIAYLSGGDSLADPPVTAELYVVNADGTGRTNASRARSRRLLLDRDGRELSWSPDGRSIVFAAARSGVANGPSELWVVRRDGTHARRLLRGEARRGADDHVPAWSPDGRLIAFARIAGGGADDAPLAASIYTVRPDGSRLRRLTGA